MKTKLLKKHPIKVIEYQNETIYLLTKGIKNITYDTLKQAKKARYHYIINRYL